MHHQILELINWTDLRRRPSAGFGSDARARLTLLYWPMSEHGCALTSNPVVACQRVTCSIDTRCCTSSAEPFNMSVAALRIAQQSSLAVARRLSSTTATSPTQSTRFVSQLARQQQPLSLFQSPARFRTNAILLGAARQPLRRVHVRALSFSAVPKAAFRALRIPAYAGAAGAGALTYANYKVDGKLTREKLAGDGAKLVLTTRQQNSKGSSATSTVEQKMSRPTPLGRSRISVRKPKVELRKAGRV